jgi:hypothetical protein
MIFSLRDITRKQRARVYSAALSETLAGFAFEAALVEARRLGLGRTDANRLAEDAERYAIASHGLLDPLCCQIANRSLFRGSIPRPHFVVVQARREQRRLDAKARRISTQTVAERLAKLHHCAGSV